MPALRLHRLQLSEHLAGWLLVLPATVILGVFHFAPTFYALFVSLFDWNLITQRTYVGLSNYSRVLTDPVFGKVLANTTYYVLGTVPATLGLSLLLAVLLNQRIRGRATFRLLYFLPYVTAVTAAAAVWKWIFDPNIGLANFAFRTLGLSPQRWLEEYRGVFQLLASSAGISLPDWASGPSLALVVIMLTQIWHFIGYDVVIFLAGLQAIPREYYEAAQIDGASTWQQHRYITWPLLSPTTFFLLVISIIGSFQVVGPILVLTPLGGYLGSTRTIVFLLYQKVTELDMGYASALGFVIFAIIFTLTMVQRRLLVSKVQYET